MEVKGPSRLFGNLIRVRYAMILPGKTLNKLFPFKYDCKT